MIFYLKVNLELNFAFRCIQFWTDVANMYGADVCIICDKESLKEKIQKIVHFSTEPRWLSSAYNDLKPCVEGVYSECWYKAGYAHLTAFFDASKNGYDSFWNIDADDTQPCLSHKKTVELLKKVSDYAEHENLDIISLDMHDSRCEHNHFSFGVAYCNHGCKVFEFYKNPDKNWRDFKSLESYNVDWYATYLRDAGKISVKSFYAENLWFIHFGLLYNFDLALHGLYHFIDGHVYMPLYESLGAGKMSFKIHTDVVCFDLGITNNENFENVREELFFFTPLKHWYLGCQIEEPEEVVSYNSLSYRIGRLITFIPRKLREILKTSLKSLHR